MSGISSAVSNIFLAKCMLSGNSCCSTDNGILHRRANTNSSHHANACCSTVIKTAPQIELVPIEALLRTQSTTLCSEMLDFLGISVDVAFLKFFQVLDPQVRPCPDIKVDDISG